MLNLLEQIKKQASLKESKHVIEKILVTIYIEQPVSTKFLARQYRLPVPVITAIKKELLKVKMLSDHNGTRLTARGETFVRETLGYKEWDRGYLQKLKKDESAVVELKNDLTEQFEQLLAHRPPVDVTLDQAFCSAETAVKRAMLPFDDQLLLGKRVLCLGDDDCISIALGLLVKKLAKTGAEKISNTTITVMDTDRRMLDFIEKTARRCHLPIVCREIDLRDRLTGMPLQSFDCVMTDPPYTLNGLKLFLSRAIAFIKKDENLIYCSFGNKEPQELLEIQQLVLTQQLIFEQIKPAYNQYAGGSRIGNISNLYVLRVLETAYPIIPETSAYHQAVYTGENNPYTRTYMCKRCNEQIQVGKGKEFRTIEQLKAFGCPLCRATLFQYQHQERMETDQPKVLGRHVLLEIKNCDPEKLMCEKSLTKEMLHAASLAGAKVVSETFHTFSPWGVSGVIIIQESHITIHTWPEYGYAAIDFFTCAADMNISGAVSHLKQALGAKESEMQVIQRGKDLEALEINE